MRASFYEDGGEKFVRVTSVLDMIQKDGLMDWAVNTERAFWLDASANLYDELTTGGASLSKQQWISALQARVGQSKAYQRKVEAAQNHGKAIHAMVEQFMLATMQGKGYAPEGTVEAIAGFMKVKAWLEDPVRQVIPIAVEQTVWCREYHYAGTLDLMALVDGELTLLDFKATNALYPRNLIQLGGYSYALRPARDVKRLMVVRIPPKPEEEIQLMEATGYQIGWNEQVFVDLALLWGRLYSSAHPNWWLLPVPDEKVTISA